MSNVIRKTVYLIRSAIRNPSTNHLYFFQIRPLSSSLASIDRTPNHQSFTVNYLINSCGFPLEKAITASKYTKFETPEKPDSVIAFFCNHGFTNTQALNLIRKYPRILSSNPEKTLLPKFEFFKSKGVSSADVVKILSATPDLLKTSLVDQIIPVFDFVNNLIGSEERTVSAIKQSAGMFHVDLETRMAPNVEILLEAGLAVEKIEFLLKCHPRSLRTSCERFRQIVEEVKGMGFDTLNANFAVAVFVLVRMTKHRREKKFEVYKKWGLSEDEILVAFKKRPLFMAVSVDKIMSVMNFLVNKMGLESSCVSKRPQLISLSFEKRIVPRCLVYQAMQAKGLIKKLNISLIKMLEFPEKSFLEMVVDRTKEEAPELLKLYKEKLALAK